MSTVNLISRSDINYGEMSLKAMSKYREEILAVLTGEPKSANEVAKYLRINQRTAQVELMRLALELPDQVKYKKIGRTNLFWRSG